MVAMGRPPAFAEGSACHSLITPTVLIKDASCATPTRSPPVTAVSRVSSCVHIA
jgi:hypothetical protein